MSESTFWHLTLKKKKSGQAAIPANVGNPPILTFPNLLTPLTLLTFSRPVLRLLNTGDLFFQGVKIHSLEW